MKNEALIAARKAKGLTQKDLANLMNCRKTSISNWENGYSTPRLPDALKLAEILGRDVDYLFSVHKVKESQTNEHTA